MLNPFHEVLYPGFTLSMAEISQLIETARGEDLTLTRMSWAPLWALAPVWPKARKLIEMRYLWDTPHALDGTDFDRLLPRFRMTDPLTAIASAVGQCDIHPDQSMARGNLDIAAE